jgi:hypothetical protein
MCTYKESIRVLHQAVQVMCSICVYRHCTASGSSGDVLYLCVSSFFKFSFVLFGIVKQMLYLCVYVMCCLFENFMCKSKIKRITTALY